MMKSTGHAGTCWAMSARNSVAVRDSIPGPTTTPRLLLYLLVGPGTMLMPTIVLDVIPQLARWAGICVNRQTNTVKPVLAVTSIKQPTCLKQPNKMFPNVKFVLIFTSVKQPPALSSHFLCFPCVAA